MSDKAMEHDLKCWPEFFAAILNGSKTFEIRKDDRVPRYEVGDVLLLREWEPRSEQYTGRETKREVSYVTGWEQKPGYVVMGLRSPPVDLHRASHTKHDLPGCPHCGKPPLSALQRNRRTRYFVASVLCGGCNVRMVACERSAPAARSRVEERWRARVPHPQEAPGASGEERCPHNPPEEHCEHEDCGGDFCRLNHAAVTPTESWDLASRLDLWAKDATRGGVAPEIATAVLRSDLRLAATALRERDFANSTLAAPPQEDGRETEGYGTTFTGLRFRHAAPTPDMVAIEDIAHALANLCHWGGHSRHFFSVAQHSVLVSLACPPEMALWGLLHDAAEAYYGDMTRPLKVLLPKFKEYETRGMRAIAERFGLSWPEPPGLKLYDNRVLAMEARTLMAPGALHDGHGNSIDLGEFDQLDTTPMAPTEAETAFLDRFAELTGIRARLSRQEDHNG